MSTLHKFWCIKDDNGGCFNFFRVSENICTIFLEHFHTEYGKCVAIVPLFAETLNKVVSNVFCEKPIILVELLLELRIVFIQDSEDGMFAELREALAGGRALDESERFIASSALGHKHLRQPVLVV